MSFSNGRGARLARLLDDSSHRVRSLLRNWLGKEVKITGKADPENRRYTLTFIDQCLGTVGQADLIFAGKDVLPSEVRCRVYAGQTDGAPGVDPGIGERRAMMEKISGKAEELFIDRVRWRVSYHIGGEIVGTLEIIDVDANMTDMTRVKNKAYGDAPPGTDMIRLVAPDGTTMTRTAKKRWVRGPAAACGPIAG
jgi:hypothetical protein